MPGRGPSPAKLEEIAERLGVPAEDRPRFIALQRDFLVEARQRRVELEGVRRLLQNELVAASPDPARLRELVETSARLQARLEGAFVEHVMAARELLSGEPERRYLQFLARLGPRAIQGPPPGPPGRQGQPRWQRPGAGPWGGGAGRQPGRMRRRELWRDLPAGPRPTPTAPEPQRSPTGQPGRDGSVLQARGEPSR
jgi:hypothetical protein